MPIWFLKIFFIFLINKYFCFPKITFNFMNVQIYHYHICMTYKKFRRIGAKREHLPKLLTKFGVLVSFDPAQNTSFRFKWTQVETQIQLKETKFISFLEKKKGFGGFSEIGDTVGRRNTIRNTIKVSHIKPCLRVFVRKIHPYRETHAILVAHATIRLSFKTRGVYRTPTLRYFKPCCNLGC